MCRLVQRHTIVAVDDLRELTQCSVFLLVEFFESIQPIVERAKPLDGDARHAFYLDILSMLIEHCRTHGMPEPHSSALLIVDIIEQAAQELAETIRH